MVVENLRIDLEEENGILGKDLIVVLRTHLPKVPVDDGSKILVVCTSQLDISKGSSTNARFVNRSRQVKEAEWFISGLSYIFAVVPKSQVSFSFFLRFKNFH